MKESKNRKKRHDEAYKKQAVELLVRSGRAASDVALELGISSWTLGQWKRKYLDIPVERGGKIVSLLEVERELAQARKENAELRRDRDILKKALAILGQQRSGGGK